MGHCASTHFPIRPIVCLVLMRQAVRSRPTCTSLNTEAWT